MTEDFAARRASARRRLDAIDPARRGDLSDPYRRGWFRAVYDMADDDPACVPWADLEPHPLLADWLAAQDVAGLRALDVGCGLGDNAEALASKGASTIAFDLSSAAIEWARRRFPASRVDYRVADLFDAPADWRGGFDLVHECYTLQALPALLLAQAAQSLARFLAPGGRLLVIARAREDGAPPSGPPWPLSSREMEAIAAPGLAMSSIEALTSSGEARHWRAIFQRPA